MLIFARNWFLHQPIHKDCRQNIHLSLRVSIYCTPRLLCIGWIFDGRTKVQPRALWVLLLLIYSVWLRNRAVCGWFCWKMHIVYCFTRTEKFGLVRFEMLEFSTYFEMTDSKIFVVWEYEYIFNSNICLFCD